MIEIILYYIVLKYFFSVFSVIKLNNIYLKHFFLFYIIKAFCDNFFINFSYQKIIK